MLWFPSTWVRRVIWYLLHRNRMWVVFYQLSAACRFHTLKRSFDTMTNWTWQHYMCSSHGDEFCVYVRQTPDGSRLTRHADSTVFTSGGITLRLEELRWFEIQNGKLVELSLRICSQFLSDFSKQWRIQDFPEGGHQSLREAPTY